MDEDLLAHPLSEEATGRIAIFIPRSDVRAGELAELIAVLEEAWVFAAEDETARLRLERAEEGSLTLWLVLMTGAKAGLLPSYMSYVSFVALLPDVAKLPKLFNELSDTVRNAKEFGRWLKKRAVRAFGSKEARAEEIRKDIASALERIAAGTTVELKLVHADGLIEERRYNYAAEPMRDWPSAAQPAPHIEGARSASPPPPAHGAQPERGTETKKLQAGCGAAEP